MAAATLSNTPTPSPPQLQLPVPPNSTIMQMQNKVIQEEEYESNICHERSSTNEGGHANFKLGIEDSPELINELRFSIAHSRHASGKNSSRRQSSSKSRSSTNPRMQLTDEDDELGKISPQIIHCSYAFNFLSGDQDMHILLLFC